MIKNPFEFPTHTHKFNQCDLINDSLKDILHKYFDVNS